MGDSFQFRLEESANELVCKGPVERTCLDMVCCLVGMQARGDSMW